MNKVSISGTIADAPLFHQPEGGAAHLAFQLCVRHRTAKGAVKRELYRVNAWNNTASWGKANLRQGQPLAVEGYLTQRIVGETGVICVEVTAEEFFPGAASVRDGHRGEKENAPAFESEGGAEIASCPGDGEAL